MKVARCVLCISIFVPTLGMTAPEPIQASDLPSPGEATLSGVAYRERIVVLPEWTPAEKSRWQKFEAALGPGRSARRTVTASRNNDGSRMECYTRCVINCCVENGTFSLLGAGFGSR